LAEFDTSKVCEIIGVSRSGFYRKPVKAQSEKMEEERAVVNCYEKHKGNYGRIRIRKELMRAGVSVSEYRISGILRRNHLVAKSGRKPKARANKRVSDEQYLAENLIKDKFAITQRNRLWCADISELRCRSGKIYISGIIDVGTRRLVGWEISKHQRQEVVEKAIEMAVGRNPDRVERAIFHSDRGSVYTANRTKELLDKHCFIRSMSRPGTPSDNQPIESFWRTLKQELPDIKALKYEEAKLVIIDYIEMYYNSARMHSGIGYQIPNLC
jgi:putative transposase